MTEDRPSATAWRVALRRAAHQLYDEPLVFDDPVAVSIIGPEAKAKLLAASDEERQSRFSRAMRAFMSVRSRFAEDQLRLAVEHGVRQYVLLGAGLDTFAYRNPDPQLRVFEVDHPATQIWKQKLTAAADLTAPSSLVLAPLDFEQQTLAEGLQRAGFRADQPAFFSWLGVVPYLSYQAVTATLTYIGLLPAGSGVVFDYGVPRDVLTIKEQAAFDAIAQRVAAAGEPFQSFFTPEQIQKEVTRLGFHAVEDLDAAAINRRYFADRTDGMKLGGSLGHLLCALI